ncbi:DUF5941 domain-containing protein [Micromonospora sp. NPDC050417]|uniref:DUF5941 domain-containing protein n=1 Tax=Micromonospora sp. NPDC050417 TaxID=3364280 RepID=UPI0037B36E75
MTLAVLFTRPDHTGPVPPVGGVPPVDRLRAHLTDAGARQVLATSTPAALAELAERSDEPILLCADDLVAHAAVLRHLATSPVGPTVALVLTDPPAAGQAVLREERGQVVEAVRDDDQVDAATGTFGGAIRVGVDDLPILAAAARSAAASSGSGPVPDRIFTALVGTDATVFSHRVRLLVAHRATDAAGVAAATSAVASVNEDKAELRLSVKEKDDFFTTYFVSTWSPYVTKLCARIGLGPTGVTAFSVLFAVAAAGLFGLGGRSAAVLGAVLLYLGFVLDCVDGQLARYTRHFSPWGGWLDTMADRAKEYVVYAGLAVGVDRAGLGNGWTLAIAALTLQTARHMTDTWYGALHDEAARRPPSAPSTGGGLGNRLSQASNRVQADTGSVSYWLKRTIVFPIGERWALIAITVALFNPLVSLVAVLVWGGLAAAYTLALRTLRARSMRVSVLARVDTTLYRDDGPVARWLGAAGSRLLPRWAGPLPLAVVAVGASTTLLTCGLVGVDDTGLRVAVLVTGLVAVLAAGLPSGRSHAGALDWLVPAALRAAEYLFVIAVDVAAGIPGPVTFALLFVLALHHYDLTARLEKRSAAPELRPYGLGWDGRLLLLVAVVLAGVAAAGETTLAGYLFVILTLGAVSGWMLPAAPARPSTGGALGVDGRAVVGTAEERKQWP